MRRQFSRNKPQTVQTELPFQLFLCPRQNVGRASTADLGNREKLGKPHLAVCCPPLLQIRLQRAVLTEWNDDRDDS